MSAIIQLDGPDNHFTNLDIISGKVILNLSSEASIGGIQVKLEGESKTRLSGPRHPHIDPDKKRTEIEVHKVRLFRMRWLGCGVRWEVDMLLFCRYCTRLSRCFQRRLSSILRTPIRITHSPQGAMSTRLSSRLVTLCWEYAFG